MGGKRRSVSAGNKRMVNNSIMLQNQAKQLIQKLQKGQIVTIVKGEEMHETAIEQINHSCIYVKLKGWMECINTADICTGRYKVWEV